MVGWECMLHVYLFGVKVPATGGFELHCRDDAECWTTTDYSSISEASFVQQTLFDKN